MSADAPLISVVIPAFNRRDSVLELIADVHAQQDASFEVIVVDDHSADDTMDAVAARFPQTRLFRNEVNGGPAVSRNRGVREARGRFILGLDSDVRVPDTTLFQRVASTFSQYPDATGLAFRLLGPDGTTDDVPRWWHPLPIRQYAEERFLTDYFSGTGYAFRRDAMVEAGMFPEILYMHYEEVELAYRILDAGGSIMHCPDLTVVHHAHPVATRGRIQKFFKARNQILIALGCYPWPRAVVWLTPRLSYGLAQAVIHKHVDEFGRALVSAWELAPQRLAGRRPLQPSTWRRIASMRKGPARMPART